MSKTISREAFVHYGLPAAAYLLGRELVNGPARQALDTGAAIGASFALLKPLPDETSRRGFLFRYIPRRLTSGVLAACSPSTPSPSETYTAPTLPKPDLWDQLSPQERIDRLETGLYTNHENFDSQQEMIKATAQYYCQRVKCKYTPEEMITRVLSLSTEDFIEKAKEDASENGLVISEQELTSLPDVEELATNDGYVYLNGPALEAYMSQKRDQFRSEVPNRDVGMIVLKSILFHSYGHVNVSRAQTPILPFLVDDKVIDRLEGFEFFGKNPDGTTYYVGGAEEAMVDYVATIVANDAGGLYFSDPYWDGNRLLKRITDAASVPTTDIALYMTGEKPLQEMLDKWAALDIPGLYGANLSAQHALFTVALAAYRSLSFEDAISLIQQNYLKLP